MPYSGYHSYTYSSDRLMFKEAKLYAEMITAVCRLAREPLPHIICGTGASGIPMATLIADRLEVGLCVLRRDCHESPHDSSWGLGPNIDERDEQGRYILRYLLVDDLVSSGGTVKRMEYAIRRVYPWHYRKCYGVWLQDRYTDKKNFNIGDEKFPAKVDLIGVCEHIEKWKGRVIRNLSSLTAFGYCHQNEINTISSELLEPGVLTGVDKFDAYRGQTVSAEETDRLSKQLDNTWF